jgi:2-dehydro-3-deoxyphosphooctonate aldolase (KDO 8-P synthase)
VILEFHPDPDKALCDGPSALPLGDAEGLLRQLKAIRGVVAGA